MVTHLQEELRNVAPGPPDDSGTPETDSRHHIACDPPWIRHLRGEPAATRVETTTLSRSGRTPTLGVGSLG